MRKKIDTVKATYRISKVTYDLMLQEKSKRNRTENSIINAALEAYLSPHERVTHERDSKIQLNSIIASAQISDNKLDLLLFMGEELIRALYFNTLAIPHQHMETQDKRQQDGIENVFKRIELKVMGKAPNTILSRFINNEDSEEL